MTTIFRDFFAEIEPIRLTEPFAQVLGAFKGSEAVLEYTFIDTVKMAGHACPTVASAYLGCKKALGKLYPGEEVPVRGNISVTIYGEADDKVYGVIGQVFGFITGACPSTGFKGLGGKFKRKDLLNYTLEQKDPEAMCFEFKRLDNGKKVLLKLFPHKMPSLGARNEKMGQLMEKVIWEAARPEELKEFQDLWMERVKKIILDEPSGDWLRIEEVT